jgi:serine/threonine protein kinase/outer membrane biosynthesis protein TonB
MFHPGETASSPDGFRPERLSGTQRRLFGGKYRIIGQIGKGGLADVFLSAAAGPFGVSKPVVIKMLQTAARDDPTLSRMFLDEARLAARLNHPNVIHTYDVGEDSGALFLAMEYLEGKTLGHLCGALAQSHTLVDVAMACHLVVEVLEGLDYAHELRDFDGSPLGIVHRDVSPQNVFVTFDGHVKVLDFGIAKTISGESQTEPGVLKGKVRYMAPEQACGSEVDRRADLFASGVLLWELLTGERLHRGETTEVLLRIVSEGAPRVSSRRPDIDPELDEIVAIALARDRDARFYTAAEMANTLTDYLSRRALAVRSGDVVSLLHSLFPGAREESRRRVDEWMEGQQASTPLLSGLTEGGTRVWPASSALRAPERRSPWFVAVSVVIVVALLGGAWFLLGRRATAPAMAAPSPGPTAAASATESFHLSLNSNPVQSDIEWNGQPLGQTPLMLDLDPGSHVFVLKRDGFHPATVVVTVTTQMSGKTESRAVIMVPVGKDEKGAGRSPPAQWVSQAKVASPAGPSPGGAVARDSPDPVPDETPSSASPANAPAAASASAFAAPSAVAAGALGPATATATAAPVATVLPYGPDMSQPRLISAVDPVFPREALVARVEGTVIAKCTITTFGSLEGCRIIKGLPFMDRPMLDALSQRRYTPVIYRGSPVAVQYVFSTHIVRP